MAKEPAAIGGREGIQRTGHGGEQLCHRPGGGLAQMSFEFGKGRFNGVKIRAIGRQIAK